MQTGNSAAMRDQEDGMARRQACRAAVGGKPRGNRPAFAGLRWLLLAAITLLAASGSGTASYAQSGPFTGMAGSWSGGGLVTLDDGSTERIRCRANYAVGAGGNGLNQDLVCASDSYKFNLRSNVMAEGGSLSGTWSESSRGVNGTLAGRGGNGSFQVLASAAGFNANITLTTRGNRQSVVIRAESQFRGASITLSRH
jgi:hypothetical protein